MSNDGPNIEEGDDDATKRAKVKAWMEDARDSMRPHVNAMVDACTEQARQLAADMGEAPTDANRRYWGTMGNLLIFGGQRLNTGSPELHALHDLARSVPRRTASQWTLAKLRCDDLFDQLDGGETLGLGQGGIHYYNDDPRDFEDPEQVADAMRIAAAFFHVPSLYAPAVGEVTTQIMRAVAAGWRELPQPWADAYCYVVACICARCGAGGIEDGQHRRMS